MQGAICLFSEKLTCFVDIMILIMKTRTKVIIAIGSNRNQEENVLKAHEHLRCMFSHSLFGPRMWPEPIGL